MLREISFREACSPEIKKIGRSLKERASNPDGFILSEKEVQACIDEVRIEMRAEKKIKEAQSRLSNVNERQKAFQALFT